MKILIVAPTPFFSDRGTPIRVYEHIRSLQEAGHRVRVITYGSGKDIGNVEIIRVPIWWTDEVFFLESFWGRIALDILMTFLVAWNKLWYRPDLLICYLHSGFMMGYISSIFSSRKIIFDCHGVLVNEVMEKQIVKSQLVIRFLAGLESFIYKRAGMLTVPSHTIRKNILKNYAIDSSKLKVINDGIANAILTYKSDKELISKLRRDLGVPKDHGVLIYTGFISNIAGIDILLDAMRILKSESLNIYLIIVGYPHEEKYIQLSQKYGIDNTVKFTGKVDYFKLPLYLDIADVAVAPRISGAEGNSKILNYLAMGLPVVCFDIPVNRELADGFAIYPKKPTAVELSQSLREAFLDLKDLQAAKKERISYVKNKYSWNELSFFINNLNIK